MYVWWNSLIKVIKKRNNDIVSFSLDRIIFAIKKAYESCKEIPNGDFDAIIQNIKRELDALQWSIGEDVISVEQIQDVVEKTLIKFNKYIVVKSYILYRQKQAEKRVLEHKKYLKNLEKHKLFIIKNNWNKEQFDLSKIKKTFDIVSKWFTKYCEREEFYVSFKKYLVDWVSTKDIMDLLIKTAIELVTIENIKWEVLAGRLMTIDLYKKASKNRNISVSNVYSAESYKKFFDLYIGKGYYYKDFYKYYSSEDILQAGKSISKKQDFQYNHSTIAAMNKRYLHNPNKKIYELPQEMFMSVALFLAIPEKKEVRLQTALKIYEYTSQQKITYPTPTLLNARTNFHQLSSCFKLNIEDDLRAIYHGIENVAQISKYAGGVWVYLGHIRSKWGYIRDIKWASGWVAPRIKVINDTAMAVNQLGSRAGAVSVTLDIWHKDIFDFLDLQTERGDIRRKSYDIFPAITIPDLFMQRVEEWGKRTLFDPKEIKDKVWKSLENTFWDEFSKYYEELENNSDLELKETVDAKELFKEFLKTVVETWMPYVFFRDTVNRLNPNKHAGNVYSTQLCVEICQNTSPSQFVEEVTDNGDVFLRYKPGDTVVCNLISLNMANIDETNESELSDLIEVTARMVDNVIDLNFYPVKETEITSKKYRSVGIGYLWLAEYLATRKIAYDSKDALPIIDKLFEKYAYHIMQASNKLAKERGAYSLFPWSEYSKGNLFGRKASRYKAESYLKEKRIDLIDNIKKDWVRFAYHLAPMPNTSSSMVVWTTASVLPIYKKYFMETNSMNSTVRVAPKLDKENFRYYKEYVNMEMNDVIDVVSTIYKRIDQSLSFERIINPVNTSPKDLYNYYFKSWKQWIKTVYYVRSMSMDVKECSSCSG